jgi:hypothetical protein
MLNRCSFFFIKHDRGKLKKNLFKTYYWTLRGMVINGQGQVLRAQSRYLVTTLLTQKAEHFLTS